MIMNSLVETRYDAHGRSARMMKRTDARVIKRTHFLVMKNVQRPRE
jgi:hypothetical protein